MRHYFFDASALVKLYSLEAGSRRVRDIVRSASVNRLACRILVCDLVQPETASALYQVANGPNPASRGLSRSAAGQAFMHMRHDLGERSWFVLLAASGWMREAAQLVWKHGLKGADAVHLATAVFARQQVPNAQEFYFVTSDRQLAVAAAAEGFAVVNPAA